MCDNSRHCVKCVWYVGSDSEWQELSGRKQEVWITAEMLPRGSTPVSLKERKKAYIDMPVLPLGY